MIFDLSFFLVCVWGGGEGECVDLPPHTHTLESKETKTDTLECKEKDQKWKICHVKNVNKEKSLFTPKIRKQKTM